MAIDFPNSPTVDDTFTVGGRTWKWNGTAWLVVPPPGGGGGLVLITSGTFSTSSGGTHDVDGCFTSDYDNYRIVFEDCTQSTPAWAGLQFRASGSTTTSGYVNAIIDRAGGGLGMFTNHTTVVGWTWADYSGGGVMEIMGPHRAVPTSLALSMIGQTSGTVWSSTGAAALQDTTQYDGFRLTPGGSFTMAGEYSVYGYAQ